MANTTRQDTTTTTRDAALLQALEAGAATLGDTSYSPASQREALQHTHSLGNASKMPGATYGIPASACHVGSRLFKVAGSTCSDCYALKGRYVMPDVVKAQEKRLALLPGPRWASSMAFLIGDRVKRARKPVPYFRWHDSGDLQGLWHLERIAWIALRLPGIRFWLPTRERAVISAFLRRYGAFPSNLTVRLSAPMRNASAKAGPVPASEVWDDVNGTSARVCPAPKQGGFCGDCRACWDPSIPSVAYARH